MYRILYLIGTIVVYTKIRTNESLCKLLIREAIRYRGFAEEATKTLREDMDAVARVAEFFAGFLAGGRGSVGNSAYIPLSKKQLARKLSIPEEEIEYRINDVSVATRYNYKLDNFATSYDF